MVKKEATAQQCITMQHLRINESTAKAQKERNASSGVRLQKGCSMTGPACFRIQRSHSKQRESGRFPNTNCDMADRFGTGLETSRDRLGTHFAIKTALFCSISHYFAAFKSIVAAGTGLLMMSTAPACPESRNEQD